MSLINVETKIMKHNRYIGLKVKIIGEDWSQNKGPRENKICEGYCWKKK